jgi:hypothetical protein
VGISLNGAVDGVLKRDFLSIAHVISAAENYPEQSTKNLNDVRARAKQSKTPVLGMTGTGGAGKSSLVDELVRRFLIDFPTRRWEYFASTRPSARRRRAPRRSHPHELDPQPARVRAVAGHATGQPRALGVRERRAGYSQGLQL